MDPPLETLVAEVERKGPFERNVPGLVLRAHPLADGPATAPEHVIRIVVGVMHRPTARPKRPGETQNVRSDRHAGPSSLIARRREAPRGNVNFSPRRAGPSAAGRSVGPSTLAGSTMSESAAPNAVFMLVYLLPVIATLGVLWMVIFDRERWRSFKDREGVTGPLPPFSRLDTLAYGMLGATMLASVDNSIFRTTEISEVTEGNIKAVGKRSLRRCATLPTKAWRFWPRCATRPGVRWQLLRGSRSELGSGPRSSVPFSAELLARSRRRQSTK